jgi:integrase/recombinase XerD
MALTKQAKTLTKSQQKMVSTWISQKRNGLRNLIIFNLSFKAGLRAKEISLLKWSDVTDSAGQIGQLITITNDMSKGKSGGRAIALNSELKAQLVEMFERQKIKRHFSLEDRIIQSERSKQVASVVIANTFKDWFKECGLIGCSSHSGRRTFITETARKVTVVGGSLRDIQYLAGHSSIQTTQRYIETNKDCHAQLVNLI